MEGKFNIFGKGLKPVCLTLFPRIPMFDPIDQIPEEQKNKIIIEQFKYSENVNITIHRPYLTALDQKVLFTLIRLGKFVKKDEKGYDFVYDFAEVKRVAGIDPKREWSYFEKILRKFQQIGIAIDIKDEDGSKKKLKVSTLAVIHYKALENLKDKSIKFTVSFSREFVGLLTGLNLFSIPLNDFKELNKIENPVVYRIITFFITQHKSQKWELFKLLKMLTPMQFDTKDKKYRIFKSIKENMELLTHYGITATETRRDGKKTYILNYQKPKWLKLDIGKHIPIEENSTALV